MQYQPSPSSVGNMRIALKWLCNSCFAFGEFSLNASQSLSIPSLTKRAISSILVWIESGAAESRRSVIAEISFSRAAISSRMYFECPLSAIADVKLRISRSSFSFRTRICVSSSDTPAREERNWRPNCSMARFIESGSKSSLRSRPRRRSSNSSCRM